MKNNINWLIALLFVFSISMVNAQSSKAKSGKATVIDLNDEAYSSMTLEKIIKKYKGQVIYLDFWASWCGPCKKEMPYSHKLVESFKDKDVAFVYISTDKNAAQWKGMIDQLQITGENYRASPVVRQALVDQFNLQYIPRYVLINKDGKVVDPNAKRPSDPAIVGDLEKLLM